VPVRPQVCTAEPTDAEEPASRFSVHRSAKKSSRRCLCRRHECEPIVVIVVLVTQPCLAKASSLTVSANPCRARFERVTEVDVSSLLSGGKVVVREGQLVQHRRLGGII